MKTLFTFLTLCSLMVFAAGCGETPDAATDSATNGSTDDGAAADLGDATGEPPVLEEQDEPFAEDGAEAGSEVVPFEEDGGPELTPNE